MLKKHGSRKQKFTLIELLVVIAIIAILAAMLLPALQSARDRGKGTSCLNNIKELGNVFAQYMDDYNDYCPYSAPNQYWWWSLRFMLPHYNMSSADGGAPIRPNGVSRDEARRMNPLFYCPSIWKHPTQSPKADTAGVTGEVYYSMVEWKYFGFSDPNGTNITNVTPKRVKVKLPSQKFLLTEASFYGSSSQHIRPTSTATKDSRWLSTTRTLPVGLQQVSQVFPLLQTPSPLSSMQRLRFSVTRQESPLTTR